MAVPSGFSWYGLVFGIFWSVYHGLWLPSAFALLALAAAIAGMQGFLATDSDSLFRLQVTVLGVLWAVIGLAFGIYGNLWRTDKLFSQGYACAATVEADRAAEAIEAFIEL